MHSVYVSTRGGRGAYMLYPHSPTHMGIVVGLLSPPVQISTRGGYPPPLLSRPHMGAIHKGWGGCVQRLYFWKIHFLARFFAEISSSEKNCAFLNFFTTCVKQSTHVCMRP